MGGWQKKREGGVSVWVISRVEPCLLSDLACAFDRFAQDKEGGGDEAPKRKASFSLFKRAVKSTMSAKGTAAFMRKSIEDRLGGGPSEVAGATAAVAGELQGAAQVWAASVKAKVRLLALSHSACCFLRLPLCLHLLPLLSLHTQSSPQHVLFLHSSSLSPPPSCTGSRCSSQKAPSRV
jgi:hypothetical protein